MEEKRDGIPNCVPDSTRECMTELEKCSPHGSLNVMSSPISKIGRKRAENLPREMFTRRKLKGMEKPMDVWSMDGLFTDNYEK